MANNSFNVKRGPVGVLFGVLFTLIFGTFVLNNDDEIIAQFEREKLTPEEILLVAKEQYKLEKHDRLELLISQDEQLCIATERIDQLESDLCLTKETLRGLKQQLIARNVQNASPQPTTSGGGRTSSSYEVANGISVDYYKVIGLKQIAKSMNQKMLSQMASYQIDPSGKGNILYFDKKKRMFTYLYPVVMPTSVIKTPPTKSKKQEKVVTKKEAIKQEVASQGKGR